MSKLNSLEHVFWDVYRKNDYNFFETIKFKVLYGDKKIFLYNKSSIKTDLNNVNDAFEFESWREFNFSKELREIYLEKKVMLQKEDNSLKTWMGNEFNLFTPFFNEVEKFLSEGETCNREIFGYWSFPLKYLLSQIYSIDNKKLMILTTSIRKNSRFEELSLEESLKKDYLKEFYEKTVHRFNKDVSLPVVLLKEKMKKELDDKQYSPHKYFIKSVYSKNPDDVSSFCEYVLHFIFN